MSATPDSTLANPEQRIADLERQLAEFRAERDRAQRQLAERTIELDRLTPNRPRPHHHHRDVGEALLDLAEKLEPSIPAC